MALGWGIMGIGRLSDAAIAPAISRLHDSDLVAVCSRSLRRAEEFAARHGAKRPYDDYNAMLADGTLDVVYIATPNALHAQHALAAIDAGKHVLIDKPMALSVPEGEQLIAAAADRGVALAVGFQLRHKAANLAARDAIRQGRIGSPRYFELSIGAGKDHFPYDTWRADPGLAGGGTLLNQGTHVIDLVQFLADAPIVEVSCLADAGQFEDVLVAACRLANGALATLGSNQVLAGTPRNWLAVGSRGWLQGRGTVGAAEGDEVILSEDGGEQVVATSTANAYDAEVAAFARAAAGAEPVNGTGEDGVRNIAVVEALYRSARDRRAVEVPSHGPATSSTSGAGSAGGWVV